MECLWAGEWLSYCPLTHPESLLGIGRVDYSPRLRCSQSALWLQAQSCLKRDSPLYLVVMNEHPLYARWGWGASSQLKLPWAPFCPPMGFSAPLIFRKVFWVASLCSFKVYLRQLLCIYTISIITSNYIISVNTCNDLNRTCNYNTSWCKNPY